MAIEGSHIFQMVLTVLIFLVGVTLNGLVVWVLGVRRNHQSGPIGGETKSAGSFRTYVVNLAIADLVLLLRIPLFLGFVANQMSWPFGMPVCQLVMFLRCLGLYAGAFLLSAIALERCLCLLRPVWASLRRPRWVVLLVCAILWAFSAGLSVPYIQASGIFNITEDNITKYHCLEKSKTAGTTLIALETGVGFILPLVIFISCNVAVIIFASKGTSGPTPPTTPVSPSGSAYALQRLNRLYRVLFFTMLLFLTCWVPYFICRFLSALALKGEWRVLEKKAGFGIYVSLFLVYLKSALNPILYVFAARGLGRSLRASLLSTIERVFNEDISDSLRRKSLRRRDSQF